jgi:Zn-dependent protease with chaperone function/tetratricopeptide (TPR) repeat protein
MLGVELIAVVAAARVGLASQVTPFIRRHAQLLSIFARSFWLKSGPEYRLLLEEREAPRLYAALRRLSERFGMAAPSEVSIEMNANAWVRLKGYRQGVGKTILAVGYDLLAGLSEGEAQAVLAHEMGHAKFIRRGVKRWLGAGVTSIGASTSHLRAQVQAYRGAGKTFHLAEMFLRPADALTRIAARLLAAYSRQDEFEADRISAELYGSASLRSALIKLELLEDRLQRVPWMERVAQLETEDGFSHWLIAELRVSTSDVPAENRAYHDVYSTHPSLRDRLAALPPDDGRQPDSAPAIGLLEDPDRIAARLIENIHRIAAEQEQQDTKSLARWARKTRQGKALTIKQMIAIGLMVVGPILPLGLLADESPWVALLAGVLFIGAGIALWRWGKYRDRFPIPTPPYPMIKKAWQAERPADFGEQEKSIEAELRSAVELLNGKRRKLEFVLREGVRALSQCEYLRAHVAARLCIHLNNKAADAALTYVVAASGMGIWSQINDNLEFVRKRTGFSTPSTAWGAAWTLSLAGDWGRAEGLLWQCVRQRPDNATILSFLALAQSQRGKLQSAALNAQRAAQLAPHKEQTKLSARILLDAGRPGEAEEILKDIASSASSDTELALLMVRLRLLRRQFGAAASAADVLRQADNSPRWLIRLGEAFETARQDEPASRFFNGAMEAGHYPEALLGLARLASNRGEKDAVRTRLVEALNVEKQVGHDGRSAVELFPATVAQLTMLEEPRENCVAWIASFPADAQPAALANVSLMVYARERAVAEQHLYVVISAMQPSSPVTPASRLKWRQAPQDQQPARAVREGVQFAL